MKEERLSLRYVTLATMKKWDRNPKPHDLERIMASILEHGFKDPPKFEPELNAGAGGIAEGNGRTEALEALKEAAPDDPPRGIGRNKKDWLVPILFGVDAPSQAAAEAYALDHNALTVLGGNFGDDWPVLLYDEEGLRTVLSGGEVVPITLDPARFAFLDPDAEGGDGFAAGRQFDPAGGETLEVKLPDGTNDAKAELLAACEKLSLSYRVRKGA